MDATGRDDERLGGHPCVDLVNTVAWRLDEAWTTDRLADAEALVGWAGAAGLVDGAEAAALRAECASEPARAERVLRRARGFRELLYRTLHALATGGAPDAGDVEALRRATTRALGRAELVGLAPMRWSLRARTLADLPGVLALSAWELLQFEDLGRLRQCADDACGWLFLDRSRNGTRRWCSSADCGNRARARRHYRRHRQAGAGYSAPGGMRRSPGA
ncbi:MAG TPA: CGNR zinc finger domain-containing protein [Streptosporangiales bacterium]